MSNILWTETNFSVCLSMVNMEVAGSATLVTPEALRMEKVGRAVDTTVTVELDLRGGRSTGTTPPFSGFVQISTFECLIPATAWVNCAENALMASTVTIGGSALNWSVVDGAGRYRLAMRSAFRESTAS